MNAIVVQHAGGIGVLVIRGLGAFAAHDAAGKVCTTGKMGPERIGGEMLQPPAVHGGIDLGRQGQ